MSECTWIVARGTVLIGNMVLSYGPMCFHDVSAWRITSLTIIAGGACVRPRAHASTAVSLAKARTACSGEMALPNSARSNLCGPSCHQRE